MLILWGHDDAGLVCPAVTVNLATFASATAGTSGIVGSCQAGYTGSPIRNCSLTGAWVDDLTDSTPCTRTFIAAPCMLLITVVSRVPGMHVFVFLPLTELSCAASNDAITSFPTATAGSTVNGVCAAGYSGSPQRTCSLTGTWLAPSGVACVRTWRLVAQALPVRRLTGRACRWGDLEGVCNAYNDGSSTWQTTTTNTADVPGTCNAGFTRTNSLSPLRSCLPDQSWGPVTNPCTRTCAAQLFAAPSPILTRIRGARVSLCLWRSVVGQGWPVGTRPTRWPMPSLTPPLRGCRWPARACRATRRSAVRRRACAS
jgi:hypothetical protein